MILYKNHSGKLEPARGKPFRIERERRRLFEQDPTQIMGWELAKSKFPIRNKRIDTKKGELDDPKGFMRDVSGIGHFGNGDYGVKVFGDKNPEYIMSLVLQTI